MRYTQPKRIYVQPFGRNLWVQWNDLYLKDCEKLDIATSHQNPHPTGGRCSVVEYEDGTKTFHVFLPRKYDEITVWHECLHAAQRLLEYHGTGTGADDGEIVAHMQGYLAIEVKEIMYKKKRK